MSTQGVMMIGVMRACVDVMIEVKVMCVVRLEYQTRCCSQVRVRGAGASVRICVRLGKRDLMVSNY